MPLFSQYRCEMIDELLIAMRAATIPYKFNLDLNILIHLVYLTNPYYFQPLAACL